MYSTCEIRSTTNWLKQGKAMGEKISCELKRESRVAQWWEHSPPTHQCGPGSIPGLDVICGLSLLLVLFPAPRGFSPGTPVFPSPQKPTLLNSNSIRYVRTFNTWAWLGRLGNHSSRYRASVKLVWFELEKLEGISFGVWLKHWCIRINASTVHNNSPDYFVKEINQQYIHVKQ